MNVWKECLILLIMKDMYQKIKEMESTIKNTEKFKESKDMER